MVTAMWSVSNRTDAQPFTVGQPVRCHGVLLHGMV
jgi:hypothetical protein